MMGPSRETIGVNFNVELVLSYVEEKVCGVQVKDPGDSRKPRSYVDFAQKHCFCFHRRIPTEIHGATCSSDCQSQVG